MSKDGITPILFLDLDGTVRLGKEQMGKFVSGPEDVELFPDMVDILRSYKARGWRIVAISNQGGIALGIADPTKIARSMEETNRLCARLFDRMYWCEHHPSAKTEETAICLCRKPRIGYVVTAMITMSEQFKEMYRPYRCLFVGDMEDDEKCADNANIPFMKAEEWRNKGPLTD